LTASTPEAGLLIAVTTRPDAKSPWSGPCDATIELGPLPEDDHETLIRTLAGIYPVDESMWGAIAARSDGNPLFTEELARSIGRQTLAGDAIPSTIRDLLTARLDALGDTKRLAQLAAVIGRDVDDDLLVRVADQSRRDVTNGLAELVAAGIMKRGADDGHASHRFVHALVQDAAYESQERLHDRREAHRRVAVALQDRAGADAGVVALHFDRAGVPDEARRYYQAAASDAQNTAADAEAIAYLDRALELTVELPDGPDRDAAELAIRIQRGLSRVNLQGYACPGAADDYRRALDLSERSADNLALFPSTAGIWAYYAVHGDLHAAAEAIDRLGAIEVEEFTAEVASCAGVQRYFEGRFADAGRELERALAAFDTRPPNAKTAAWWSLPNDPQVAALTHHAALCWLRGENDASEQAFARAARLADALPFATGSFSTGYTTSYRGWLANVDGRYTDARALHEQVIAIGERNGLLFWTATGTCQWAIARGHLGEPDWAIEVLEPAIEQWRALGAETFVPYLRTQLGEIRLGHGQHAEALADVERAIEQADRTGEQWFSAESHRVRGAILQRMDPDDAGRALDAIDTAQRLAADQGALVFELRAATDAVALVAAADRAARLAALRAILSRLPAGAVGDDVARATSLLGAVADDRR
jgi:tetratricopeptide (TPR) repeat protein